MPSVVGAITSSLLSLLKSPELQKVIAGVVVVVLLLLLVLPV